MLRVLLTGFEPFGKYSENSSWTVAEKVAACGVVGAEVMAKRLLVSFAGVGTTLRKAVEECHPDVIIMLGQCAGVDYIKLERIAINMMDAPPPTMTDTSPMRSRYVLQVLLRFLQILI